MRRVRCLLVTVLVSVLAAVLVVLVPSSATAERWSASDPRGDAEGFALVDDEGADECAEPPAVDAAGVPNVDLTRLGVRHSADAVEVAVRFRELRRGDLGLRVSLLVPGRDWTVSVHLLGRHRYVFLVPDEEKELDEAAAAHPDECSVLAGSFARSCRGLRARRDLAADVVRVTLPRRCIAAPRWVRVGASTSAYRPATDTEPAAVFSDHWAPRGTSDDAERPVYGPRVRPPATR